MAWRETCIMDQRIGFIVAWREGEESMAVLCRHFGISRKSGHKWLARYRTDGVVGLAERSRAPRPRPRAVGDEVVAALLAVRQRHPSWAPRKVKAWLEDRHGDQAWRARLAGSEHERHRLRPGWSDPAAQTPPAGGTPGRLPGAERRLGRRSPVSPLPGCRARRSS